MGDLEVFFNSVEPQVEAITGEENDTAQFKNLVAVFNKVQCMYSTHAFHRYAQMQSI